ncbi:MAG: hypothetical protein GY832_22030 [Chloroflexi bacterium]|nr:hypothetical protein [Chloroflexota bacterium]
MSKLQAPLGGQLQAPRASQAQALNDSTPPAKVWQFDMSTGKVVNAWYSWRPKCIDYDGTYAFVGASFDSILWPGTDKTEHDRCTLYRITKATGEVEAWKWIRQEDAGVGTYPIMYEVHGDGTKIYTRLASSDKYEGGPYPTGGATPTAATVALAGIGAGDVDNGTHRYKIVYATLTAKSAAGTASDIVTVTDNTDDGKIALSGIPTGPGGTVARLIYRTTAGTSTYKYLATLSNGTVTTYTDGTADADLGDVLPAMGGGNDVATLVAYGTALGFEWDRNDTITLGGVIVATDGTHIYAIRNLGAPVVNIVKLDNTGSIVAQSGLFFGESGIRYSSDGNLYAWQSAGGFRSINTTTLVSTAVPTITDISGIYAAQGNYIAYVIAASAAGTYTATVKCYTTGGVLQWTYVYASTPDVYGGVQGYDIRFSSDASKVYVAGIQTDTWADTSGAEDYVNLIEIDRKSGTALRAWNGGAGPQPPLTVAPSVALAGQGAGNVDNGTHKYFMFVVSGGYGIGTIVPIDGGTTRSTPESASVNVTDKTSDGKVSITNIPLQEPSDEIISVRRIYRTKAGGSTWFLLDSLGDTDTTYLDNTADADLVATSFAPDYYNVSGGTTRLSPMTDNDTLFMTHHAGYASWATELEAV